MEFSTKAEKLQPDSGRARLYFCTPDSPLNDEAAKLLRASLKEGECFAAAQTVENGRLNGAAVACLADLDRKTVEKAAAEAAAWAQKQQAVDVDLTPFCETDSPRVAEIFTLAAGAAVYRFDRFKKEAKPAELKNIAFCHDRHAAVVEQALAFARAALYGINLCKDLANTAPNVCTPTYLAETAKAEAEQAGAAGKILGRDYIENHMPSFWGVAKGSVQEPKLLELSYFGAADSSAPPVVLVGKGLTFDSGGISLKPGEAMDEMKYDMCGAASVIGTFVAAVKAKLPVNLIAVVAACENMPDGGAAKPGDIVKAMNGITIENLNTDAEGRLVLCDALTYAEQFKPAAVIDVATLTGACIIALGHVASGVMGNRQELVDELLAASRESNDKIWQLPLFEEYREQLKSNFADLQNIGGRAAGTITAATFLAHFAENYPWAHLDIAGTAWKSGKDKGATGRPVPLLLQFLKNRA
ncbi:leucyl aminopeptidase [Neisseria leonii]|uniref:leucyl aminopeptidase n=1 Tax=Neisseria leonii TaxID=2995413 RepID=UPI00237AFF41|nr:leucyl aminopeptidase [Neisseria sp. 3986]MDD9325234.1 leucyl aminopeptidase [Neisseria sp. 3986]